MNNLKSVEKVFQTSDYAKFKTLKGNRPLKKTHLMFLKESISKHGDLGVPIIVNEKYEIIDGGHRVEVLKELKLPVLFISRPGFGIKEVHVLNSNRMNWSLTNFMHCYADLGMEHYVKYRTFYNKYKFAQTTTLMIIQGATIQHAYGTEPFRHGEFVFGNIQAAENRAEKILMAKNIYYGYKKRYFVNAMIRLFNFEEYNHSEFLSKLKQNAEKLLIEPNSVNGYLRIFEDIYNFNRRGKKVSFYQDLRT